MALRTGLYTALEQRYLRRYYPHATNAHLAAKLGRTPAQLGDYARKPGRRWAKLVHPTHFAPGCASPKANPLGNGALSVWSYQAEGLRYLMRRLAPGRHVQEHRYQWELLHGPLPAGHVLRCRSADTLNCDPANWELLSRSAHGRRNKVRTGDTPQARLTDNAVAQHLTYGRPDLRAAVRNCPELLSLKRAQLLLERQLTATTHEPS